MRKPSVFESALFLFTLVTLALGATSASAALPAPTPCSGCWQPSLQSRWQYQLQGVAGYASTGGINTTISAPPQRLSNPLGQRNLARESHRHRSARVDRRASPHQGLRR